MKNRLSPLWIRGKKFKNRVLVPPMASSTADEDGFATPETIAHYETLTESGAALVIAEYTFVHSSGRSEARQLGASSNAHVSGLSRIARSLQSGGALAGLQITHAGGKSDAQLTGQNLMAPSPVAIPVKDRQLERPRGMTDEDIELWRTSFLNAVDRAAEAGFDLVEFHAAHGYGLNQWLSPITNRRTDAYGGTLAHRGRLLSEIVRAARRRYPELLISVRMPGQDFIEGGLRLEDTIALAKHLVEIGVDLIHVSSGLGGWRRPGRRDGEGYLVAEAAEIQSRISAPVIGVGGIETGRYIDQALEQGLFSLAAVGRAILKNPHSWGDRELREP